MYTLFCERVHFSSEFWNSIFPKLDSFYNWIIPELAYPRVKDGLDKMDARSI